MEDRHSDRKPGASSIQPETGDVFHSTTAGNSAKIDPSELPAVGAITSSASTGTNHGRILNLSALQFRISNPRPNKAKSIGTSSTTSTVPVLVRSYPGPRPPRQSRRRTPASAVTGTRTTSNRAQAMDPLPSLPPVAEFAFSHVLLTMDSEIQDPIDAISSICARSRYSLADEYGAHLPPQGEIRDGLQSSNFSTAAGRHGLFIRTTVLAESALSVVQEASSSSAASDSGTMRSAYGSLRNVLSRRETELTCRSDDGSAGNTSGRRGYSWIVANNGRESIILGKDVRPLRQVQRESSQPVHHILALGSTTRATPTRNSLGWLWGNRNETPQPSSASDRLKELLQVEVLEYG